MGRAVSHLPPTEESARCVKCGAVMPAVSLLGESPRSARWGTVLFPEVREPLVSPSFGFIPPMQIMSSQSGPASKERTTAGATRSTSQAVSSTSSSSSFAGTTRPCDHDVGLLLHTMPVTPRHTGTRLIGAIGSRRARAIAEPHAEPPLHPRIARADITKILEVLLRPIGHRPDLCTEGPTPGALGRRALSRLPEAGLKAVVRHRTNTTRPRWTTDENQGSVGDALTEFGPISGDGSVAEASPRALDRLLCGRFGGRRSPIG